MRITQYIFSLLLIVTVVGCNKVELEPITPSTSPDPVFTASLIVDGISSSIVVGENANLTSSHESIGLSPYIGTSFTDLSGNDLLSFDFSFLTPLSTSSFSSPVEFGSLTCDVELDVANIQTNLPILSYAWIVNGQTSINTNVNLTEFGVYDVVFSAVLSDGSQVELKDKITLGGLELYQPEIEISEIGQSLFACTPLNITSDIDSVRWEVHSSSQTIITSNEVQFVFSVPNTFESYVAECYFYINGNMVNYSSKMFTSSIFPAAPLVDISPAVYLIESSALPFSSRGKVTYAHNGITYTTMDGQIPTFQMNNIQQFIDEYSGDVYLKGEIVFQSYLYNSSGDSIYVEIESEIGFLEMPG